MLRITHQAATVLNQMRATAGAPDSYGVRFFAQPAAQGTELGLDFVAQPAEGDQVSKQEDLSVFVAAGVADPLTQAVVDAKPVNGAPQLVLDAKGQSTEQPPS